MEYKPKKYQEIAQKFLEDNDRCALFLDMGLGKTVVTLTHVKKMIDKGSVHKVLVIAPKRVAEDTWSRESEKWDHLHSLRLSKILGSAKARMAALEADADVYVINRENVCWIVDMLGYKWPFEMVVIDELSSFKSAQAKRWRSLKRVIKLSPYVVGLTGTPASNGYMDLWPEMFLIDNGHALGRTLTTFRDTYFVPGARKGHIVYEWKLRTGAQQRIDARLKPVCLSMSKEDWLEMPPIIYNNVYVRMDRKERNVYEQIERDKLLPLFEGTVSSLRGATSAVVGASAASLVNKLLQMSNGAVYDDSEGVFQFHERKLDALEELVEGAGGSPILCFYSYKHDADRILSRISGARVLQGTSDISDWNEGRIPLLLTHPASAGHGLNLQDGGHTVVWFGMPWSLELYQQANARLYRQGQERSVIVHHIMCENTMDDRVLTALRCKDTTQKALLDALKGYMDGSN